MFASNFMHIHGASNTMMEKWWINGSFMLYFKFSLCIIAYISIQAGNMLYFDFMVWWSKWLLKVALLRIGGKREPNFPLGQKFHNIYMEAWIWTWLGMWTPTSFNCATNRGITNLSMSMGFDGCASITN